MFASELNADPDAQLIYADEDSINLAGERSNPRFKPDWNPDLFCSFNYISRFVAIRTDLVKSAGGFRSGIDGQEDFDLLLRITASLESRKIRHLPHLLGHTTGNALAQAAASGASPEQVVQEQLQKRDPRIRVVPGKLPGTCHVRSLACSFLPEMASPSYNVASRVLPSALPILVTRLSWLTTKAAICLCFATWLTLRSQRERVS
jgi:hypothetical protein